MPNCWLCISGYVSGAKVPSDMVSWCWIQDRFVRQESEQPTSVQLDGLFISVLHQRHTFRTPAVSRNITSMSTSMPVNLSLLLSSALGCTWKQFCHILATCYLSIPFGTCPAGTVPPFISSCCHFHHTEWLPILTFNSPSLTHLLIPLSARNRLSTYSALSSLQTNQCP